MIRIRSVTTAGAIAIAAIAGCDSRAPRDGARPHDAGAPRVQARSLDVPVPATTLDDPQVPLPGDVAVTLLDGGAAPRAPLRYRRADAPVRTVSASVAVTSRALADATWSEPEALPPLRYAAAVTVDAGALRLRPMAVAVDGVVPAGTERLVASQQARWRGLAGRRATATVDDRGRVTALAFADVTGDTGAPRVEINPDRDELWQWLLGLATPLPDEPVGVGARWRAVVQLRGGQATIRQETEYTLVAVDGDAWTLDVVARRVAPPQDTVPPGLPAGAKVELVGLLRELRGRVVVSAADPLPVEAALSVELRVHTRLHVPGRSVVETATEDVGEVSVTSGP